MEFNILNNKIGGEKIFSLWWLFILAVVGIGIVAGVLIFYSSPIDAREAEAKILYERISNCLIRQGFLVEGILDKQKDIFEECQLNKMVFSEKNIFYFHLVFFEREEKIREDITEGVFSFEKDCEIVESGEVEAKEFPRCVRGNEEFFYYSNGEIKKGNLKMLVASNQEGRRIPYFKQNE